MNVLTVGETLALVRADEIGGLETIRDLKLAIGGAESNVAVGLRRLGIDVTWIGRVGADSLGRRVERELSGERITVHAIVDDAAPTAVMIKENRTAFSSRVLYFRSNSAGSKLCPSDLDVVRVDDFDIVHLTGITPSLSTSAREAVDRLISDAEKAHIPISFDVNHRSALWPDGDPGELYRSIARRSTVVFAGEAEARLLAPGARSVDDLLAEIRSLGPTEAVIKLGERGASADVDGTVCSEPAIPISPVDTVGAGDAFVSGYLAERLLGRGAQERLRTAVKTGAYACLHASDWEGFARRSDLELFGAADPVAR